MPRPIIGRVEGWRETTSAHPTEKEQAGIPLSDYRAGGMRWGRGETGGRADSLGRAVAARCEFRWTVTPRRSLAGAVRWPPKAPSPLPGPLKSAGTQPGYRTLGILTLVNARGELLPGVNMSLRCPCAFHPLQQGTSRLQW